jgi:hypothetical protein
MRKFTRQFRAGKVYMRFSFSAAHLCGRVPRFLLASLISAGLITLSLCLFVPQAKAALQDGAAATIDGTIRKIMQTDAGFELYIEDDSLDGKRVYITTQDEQSCKLLSQIHATGTINQPVMGSNRIDWHLTNATFSCK